MRAWLDACVCVSAFVRALCFVVACCAVGSWCAARFPQANNRRDYGFKMLDPRILRELGSLCGDVHTHDVRGIHYLGTATRAIVSSPGPGARGFDGRSEAATSSLRHLRAMAVGDAGANSLERWDAEQETNRLCVTATVTRQDDPPYLV